MHAERDVLVTANADVQTVQSSQSSCLVSFITSCVRGDTICPRPSTPSVGAEAPHAAEPTET